MIKQLFLYGVVFVSLYFICFYLHQNYLEKHQISIPFSLEKMYFFLAGFSMLLCVNLLLLSKISGIYEQLGFIYLGSIVLKILLFGILFYNTILIEENLSQNTRISIFIPVILFLLAEVVFITKVLNQKDSKKK